ncbi:hypothetical protein [Aureibacter tunicatorum]|uniref:Uncharacterized protein n=1 Tax=Aureibacter tunicatorum TaxID=866807 RepID=A0AAE4BSW8_9BACT|nr:hypothetical protein [Aureibacter tunicatorum]MDR6239248.1 hypothetical protein [Aureibacter tunicatorum]BDD04827.1 hypothetical protein AUTU_23100 [Aureibacter tunicatorum]
MEVSTTQVPLWLSILFIISFATIPVLIISNAGKTAYEKANLNGSVIKKQITLFYWAYFLVVSLASLTGFFTVNALPPRMVAYVMVPLFLFYVLAVQKSRWFRIIFDNIKLDQLIFIHSFRFIGVFFFLAYAYGALPKQFAYIGGSGDIISAILVFPVILAIKKQKTYAKAMAIAWNIIGLLDIIFVISTAFIVTKAALETGNEGVAQFGTFPFSLIPAFAPATIVFLHLITFKKIKNYKFAPQEPLTA